MRQGQQVRPVQDFLTAAQVAERVGVNRSTVLRWAREGKLRAYKLAGSRVLIDPADVAGVVAEVVPRP